MSSQPAEAAVLLRWDGACLRITLNHPAKKNALSDDMVRELITALEGANNDSTVRSVLIDGAGPDFCAGADVIARNREDDGARPRPGSIRRRLPSLAHRLIAVLWNLELPTVASVSGWTVGIGLNLAAACDFIVAAQDARFWAPFLTRGFTPDSGAAWLLPRRVGLQHAREMILLGRKVDAQTAREWGLAYDVVPNDQLHDRAAALAATLAEAPTVAAGLAKWLINSGVTSAFEDHLSNEAFAMELSSRSRDFREGMAAFIERRPPRFTGA